MDVNGDINPFDNNTPPRSVALAKIQKPTPVKNRAVRGLEIVPVVDRIPTPKEEYMFNIEDKDGSEAKAAEAARVENESINSSFRRLSINGSFGSVNGLTPTPVKTPSARTDRSSVAIAHEILKKRDQNRNHACTPTPFE
jgi:hypothetical protein